MGLDTVLLFACDAGEAAVICLFFYRRLWRIFPVFLCYVTWDLIGNLGGYFVLKSHPSSYAAAYLTVTILDSILLFGVLVELAWSILRPVRTSLSRRALIPVVGLMLAVGAAIWPFATFSAVAGKSQGIHLILRLQQTVSILQVIFLLALIGGSQLLSIGWRDRELQIATGLGFFSAVNFAAAVLHTHQASYAQVQHLNQAIIGAYICCLLYWIVSFVRQEAERREFTPQMQNFLLAVAGAARANRIALTESRTGKPPKHDQR